MPPITVALSPVPTAGGGGTGAGRVAGLPDIHLPGTRQPADCPLYRGRHLVKLGLQRGRLALQRTDDGLRGQGASLRKLADSSADPAVRVDATRSIGIVSSKDAGVALRELYRTSKDADVRRAALEGLMIHGDQQGLLEIYRSSKDPQEKKDVLRQLTVIGGDAAMEAIDAALEGKSP